jgi:hypothetical protein
MYKKLIKNISILFLTTALVFPQTILALNIDSQPEDVSVSAIVAGSITPLGGGGGGGGILSGLIFSGLAYPKATVHVWKDGVPKTTTIADSDGHFSITFSELYNPNVLYTLYAIDKEGRKSILLNYPVVTKAGYYTEITGIRFPPTIATDKTEVKLGDSISILGYALPSKDLEIVIERIPTNTYYVKSSGDGTYQLTVSLLDYKKGSYNTHVNYPLDKKISKVIQFIIGDINISSVDLINNIPGDCNADGIINIVDFSVAAFWYHKPNPPKCVDTNNDNIIDLVDFSILAFYWTG